MDRWALAEVNTLLGNALNTAALEMIAIGGSFTIARETQTAKESTVANEKANEKASEVAGEVAGEMADEPVLMATSGAEMELTVDGTPMPWRTSFLVKPGQVVRCGYARGSIYSYLQVAGGFITTPVLGSCSTHSRSGFGGFNGRPVKSGDELPLKGSNYLSAQSQQLPAAEYLARESIRIVWGTQSDVFSAKVRNVLLNSEFSVSAERDRMGARLLTDAGSMASETGLSGVSDAVLIGDIQVAGDGVATVLLADRQPTGGYPRIATVITADLDAISQMPTGKPFRFELVTASQAVDALRQRVQSIDNLSSALESVTRQPEDIPNLLSYNLIDGVVAAK